MTLAFSAEAVIELARDTWTALLSDDGLLPGDGAGGSPSRPAGLAARIDISGEWNGTACLSCSVVAGRRAAAVMFGMEEEELTPADVLDAIGELVNVVGGNIKGLLPHPTALSLPVVHDEEANFELEPHLELMLEASFTWMEEPVMVTVWTPGV